MQRLSNLRSLFSAVSALWLSLGLAVVMATPARGGVGRGGWGLARRGPVGYVAAPGWTVSANPVVTYQVAPARAAAVSPAPVLLQMPQAAATSMPYVAYTLPAQPTVHYLAVIPGTTALSPSINQDLLVDGDREGLALDADGDAVLLRSDAQYRLLSSRMGGDVYVRALKSEVRAKLLREVNRRGGSARGINWMRFLFRVARAFFFTTYGRDIPGDLFGLIERLIRDVLREEGISAPPAPRPSEEDGMPFDGEGEDSATGRRFRIRGTIEVLTDGAPDRPSVDPDDDVPAQPPTPIDPADLDPQDQAQPAPPPRR